MTIVNKNRSLITETVIRFNAIFHEKALFLLLNIRKKVEVRYHIIHGSNSITRCNGIIYEWNSVFLWIWQWFYECNAIIFFPFCACGAVVLNYHLIKDHLAFVKSFTLKNNINILLLFIIFEPSGRLKIVIWKRRFTHHCTYWVIDSP